MKFIHLSDLHLGKRLNEFSLIEDQEYILNKIINIIDDEKPDAVIIAGDIYDKPVPPAEAVRLFDDFLCSLALRRLQVFVISGNHDSAERIAFGSRLMDKSGIHMAPVYDGNAAPVSLEDEYGIVDVYMLPFVKPAGVRRLFKDEQIDSYTDALRACVKNMNVDSSHRNILVTHQFVTGALRSDSEEISIGGADNVDAAVFGDFDYTALGHIHRPQNCKSDKVRYCGTPLKYSFSEAKDKKSVTVVELCEKGNMKVRTVELVPLRDMHEIKGSYDQIMRRDFYKDTSYQEDYMHITLTDEEDIPDAVGKLRTVYHNLMKLDYDNTRTSRLNIVDGADAAENKSPFEHFEEFYELQNNQPMTSTQSDFMKNLIEQIWEEEE